MAAMFRILLVDDHPVVATACRWLLESSGMATVIDAGDADAGYAAFLEHKPDVVVVDLRLHGQEFGGIGLIERIHLQDPGARILVFSMHADPRIVALAIAAGAMGYLLKDAPPDELGKAVQQVKAGQIYMDPQLAMKVALLRKDANHNVVDALTPRERQALTLLADGKSYQTIADQIGISYKTVVNLTYRLRQKLGARGLSDLIRLAVELTRPKH